MLQNLLLNRLLKGDQPRVVLAFDSKGDNFRHELYPEYKANRGPCPEDLIPQFDLVREAADAFGIVQVQAEGFEADDVIATLAKRAVEEGVDVDILSGDKDLMQLITPR
jgi:DNA polymerase-1